MLLKSAVIRCDSFHDFFSEKLEKQKQKQKQKQKTTEQCFRVIGINVCT